MTATGIYHDEKYNFEMHYIQGALLTVADPNLLLDRSQCKMK